MLHNSIVWLLYVDVIITISRPKLTKGCSAKKRQRLTLIVDGLKTTRFDPSRTSSGFFSLIYDVRFNPSALVLDI